MYVGRRLPDQLIRGLTRLGLRASRDPTPRRRNAATSAGCSRRSPIATTSSRDCCRSGAIGAGRRGSSSWRTSAPAIASLDLACGTGDLAFAAATRGATCRRARHHAADDRAGAAEAGRRDAVAWMVGDMTRAAGRQRLVRCRHDRLRSAQRAGSAARARRRSIACSSPAAGCARSTSIGRKSASAARDLSRVPRRSSDRRSAGCCIAIPTPIATFPRRFAGIPARAASSR